MRSPIWGHTMGRKIRVKQKILCVFVCVWGEGECWYTDGLGNLKPIVRKQHQTEQNRPPDYELHFICNFFYANLLSGEKLTAMTDNTQFIICSATHRPDNENCITHLPLLCQISHDELQTSGRPSTDSHSLWCSGTSIHYGQTSDPVTLFRILDNILDLSSGPPWLVERLSADTCH